MAGAAAGFVPAGLCWDVASTALACPCSLPLAADESERELNTEEEEEAKFKQGASIQNCWEGVDFALGRECKAGAAGAAHGLAPPPRLPPRRPHARLPIWSPRAAAVRTGVVQRPKDKILSMDPKEITYEMVQKKLGEIAMARGKTTRVDRQEHVRRGYCGAIVYAKS